MKESALLTGGALVAGGALATGEGRTGVSMPENKEVYELKIYRLSGGGGVNQLRKYYTEAMIPFLKTFGAKVGAFGEYGMTDPPSIYILHVHNSPDAYWKAVQQIKKDERYFEAAKSYFAIPPEKAVFERYETLLLEAFSGLPQMKMPDPGRGLFELRIYESHNEDAFRRKVMMFNKEEIPLFLELGLHPLLFGEILAGGFMPALGYMLWFKNMEEREANWNKFRESPAWAAMRVKEEYANTVSKVRKTFLVPLDFSEI